MAFNRLERLSDQQIVQLHTLCQNEWWTSARTLPDAKRMLGNTNIMLGLCEDHSEKLIAFARVLTEKVYKAFILDVIVDPDYRTKGLGKEIMQMILRYSKLIKVKHFELYCLPELIPFYKKWGFTDDLG